MLRNAYAQRPLDGTSETSPVLLRLLRERLIGAVSITCATEENGEMREKKGQNKLFLIFTRRSGRGERTEALGERIGQAVKTKQYFVYHDRFNTSCK